MGGGTASIAIGLLLVAVSMVLANETRSLIAGEAVAPPILEDLKRVIAAEKRIPRVDEVATLHLGPRIIMVALTVSFDSETKQSDFGACVEDLSKALKAQDERVSYVYVRPAPMPR
jgi:divalent metal cation (Fe/Co/Zn/Cd) transporter